MRPRGPVRISLDATTAPGPRPRYVVYLHVNGRRFELEAPTAARAREMVVELAREMGLDQEPADG